MSEKTQVVAPRAAQHAHQAPGRAEEGTEAPGGRGRGALGWFLGDVGFQGHFLLCQASRGGGPEAGGVGFL